MLQDKSTKNLSELFSLLQVSLTIQVLIYSLSKKDVPICNPRRPKGTFSGYTKPKKSPLVLPFCKRYTSF